VTRPEPATPVEQLLDLLARADALAGMVASAIAAGTDDDLAALLDERAAVVDEIVRCLPLVGTGLGDPLLARALDETCEIGERVQQLAALTRQQVQATLAGMDARQQATDEYTSARNTGAFSVIV
jgi:hypothetical protein